MQKIKIKNSKGQSISAVIDLSVKNDGRLAILCPGYLDSKDYPHLVDLAKKFVTNGYDVVRFDPTGTWESEGEISDYTTSQYISDIKSVLDYISASKKYDEVLVGGHSRGGQVSIFFAAQDARVNVVFGIMPPSAAIDAKRKNDWEKAGFRISKRDLPKNTNKSIEFNVPFSYVLDCEKYDTLHFVKKIKVPLILFAGELDNVITPAEVKIIYEAAGDPKRFVLLKGINHDYRHSPKEIDEVNSQIIDNILLK